MLHLQSHCCYLNCYSKQSRRAAGAAHAADDTTLHCATYTTLHNTNWPSVKCFRCIVTILAQGLLPSTWYFLQLISLIVHPSSFCQLHRSLGPLLSRARAAPYAYPECLCEFLCVHARANNVCIYITYSGVVGGSVLGKGARHQSACKIRAMHAQAACYLFLLRKACKVLRIIFIPHSARATGMEYKMA